MVSFVVLVVVVVAVVVVAAAAVVVVVVVVGAILCAQGGCWQCMFGDPVPFWVLVKKLFSVLKVL